MAEGIGGIKITIDAEDNASGKLKEVSAAVSEVGKGASEGKSEVKALSQEMNTGGASAKKYSSEVSKTSESVKKNTRSVSDSEKEYQKQRKEIDKTNKSLEKHQKNLQQGIKAKTKEQEALRKTLKTQEKGTEEYENTKKQQAAVAKELTGLHKKLGDTTNEIDKNNKKLTESEKAYKKVAKSAKEVEKSTKAAAKADKLIESGERYEKIGKNLNEVTKPLQVASVAVGAAGVLAVKSAMDYETAFTGVRKTVEGTPEQLEEINKQLKEMSLTTPVSASGLAGIAAAGGQLGVATPNIVKFTKTMADLSVATNLGGEEGAAILAKFVNVSGDSMENIDRIGSSIVALGNNTATTEADIAEMALKMAKFGNTVGMNSNQVLGYSAALSSMGIEAQAGGSAIGRVWMDIQKAVSGGGDDLKEYAKMAGMSAKDFKKAWGTDSSGAFNSIIKGLSQSKDLIGSLEKLGVENTLDVTSVLALANNYELLEKCLNLSSTAYKENTALTNEANTAYGTTANQIQLAKNAVTNAAMSLGEQMLPAVTKGANKVSSLAKGFGNLSDDAKKAVIATGGVVVGLGATTKAAASTIETVGKITKGVGELKKLKIAKGAASLLPTLGAVGAATAGVAAAVGVSVYMYKKYKDAQINWGKSLEEANQKLTVSVGKVNSLRQVQGRLEKLKLVINSEKSSKDEVAAAKEELKQIAEYLNKEYSLNITVNDDDLDGTIEKIRKLTKAEQKQQLPQMLSDASEANLKLAENKEKHEKAAGQITKETTASRQETQKRDSLQNTYAALKREYDKYQNERKTNDVKYGFGSPESIDASTKSLQKFGEKVKEIQKQYGKENFKDLGFDFSDSDNWNTEKLSNLEKYMNSAKQHISNYDASIKNHEKNIEGLTKSENEWQQTVSTMTDAGAVAYSAGETATGINLLKTAVDEYGASASETAQKATLFNNNIESLGDMKGKPQAEIQKLEQEATNLLRNFEGYGDKSIKFNVEADLTAITDAEGKISELENSNLSVSINANGDLTILDKATGEMGTLKALGAASLQVNADGNIDILDEAGEKMATLDTSTKKIEVNGDYQNAAEIQKAIEDGERLAGLEAGKDITANGYYFGKSEIAQALQDGKSLTNRNVVYTVTYKTIGVKPNAKGTKNFKGGLAMVNDEKGTSDPRELIVDRGHAFIPEGRDVILPLSRGAKVYTASQTKRLVNGLGIKHYASGKDNDDIFTESSSMPNESRNSNIESSAQGDKKWREAADPTLCVDRKSQAISKVTGGKSGDSISSEFKAAQEAWEHIVNSRAVSVTEDLEKWVEFSEKFKTNAKDIEAIEEGIYTRTLAVRNELNELSQEYIAERTALGDWETFGDSPLAAFNRVKEREAEYVSKGVISEREAKKQLAEIGKQMYDDRISLSENWLEHETKYSKMSADEYIDGLRRMMKYTEEAYAAGMLSVKEYYEAVADINDKITDKQIEKQDSLYDSWVNDRDSYLKQRQAYNDWGDFGDSEYKFWQRVIEREQEFFEADGDWDKHYANIVEAQINMYNANAEVYDKMLSDQSEYIDSVSEYYDKLIDKKRTAYEEKNMYADLAEAEETKRIYAGAVTQKGKDTYKDALKQIDELKNEIEIAELTKKQAKEVEALRADYEKAEAKKDKVLKDVKNIGYDMQRIVESIEKNSSNTIMPVLNELLRTLKSNSGASTVYGPTTLNISAGNAGLQPFINGLTGAFRTGNSK